MLCPKRNQLNRNSVIIYSLLHVITTNIFV
uniref:Uncharacterized protein n=1 Tax=Lepeophtheirus salmonis TaxID=72036 RepID=A0A0K2T168_LEPSM